MNTHDLLLRIDVALTELESLKDELIDDVNEYSRVNALMVVVCNECDVDYDDLMSTSRKKHIVIARTIIVHELRRRQYKYAQIGKLIQRDHSSCVHAMRVYEDRMKYDPEFQMYCEKVNQRLHNERR